MPASMISAPAGGSEKVSGNSRLIVASGPSPGSRPTSMPTTQPVAQSRRFCSVSAWLKPKARLLMTSICGYSIKRKLHAEEPAHRERDGAERNDDRGRAWDREIVARERGDRRHYGDAGQHVHVFGNEREADEARGDQREIAPVKFE